MLPVVVLPPPDGRYHPKGLPNRSVPVADAARRRPTLLAALIVCAGCRVPPTDPAACGRDSGARSMLLARQVARDTAVMSAAYPRTAAFVAVTEPSDYLRAWAAGI